jgi:hypothetical protein
MDSILIIPIAGMITGIIIPVAAFIWLYHDEKNKRAAVVEISKNLDDPTQVEELIRIFEERKRQPLDYRRGGHYNSFCWFGSFCTWILCFGEYSQRSGCFSRFNWGRNLYCGVSVSEYWKGTDRCGGRI